MLYQTTPSQAYLAECERDRLVQANSTLDRLRRSFDRFWADPVANAALLGTSAGAAFGLHAASAQYVATIAPELIAQIPQVDAARWTLTWGEDGSLTIAAVS